MTGRRSRPTLDFARRLADRGTPIWIRFVARPGPHRRTRERRRLARFAAGLAIVERVDVLPFHRLGAAKYAALGRPFPLAATSPPSEAELARVRAQFSDHGLVVT